MDIQNLFSTVLNMTVTGSIITGVVLLTRLVLGKAPKVFSYWLWLVVLFRLLCPVSVSAPVSVLGAVDAPAASSAVGTVEYVALPETTLVQMLPSAGSQQSPTVFREQAVDWSHLLVDVWIMGAGAVALYGVLSYVSLKRRLRESVPVERGVREADGIRSPFVLGLLRPVIYLPAGLEDRAYILLHERFHIRHGDHLVKGLFWLAVCIHWFNPLVWLAFVLCGRDMELRCDEAVLKRLGGNARSGYAQSLLNCAAGRRIAPTPLAFCEGDTETRVKHVLKWKRKKLWVAVLAAALSVTVLVLSACNPELHSYENQRVFNYRYRAEAVLGDPDPVNSYYYPREYDSQLTLWVDEAPTELGELVQKKLGTDFGLSDPELERELREQNDLAWKAGEYWLLYQQDDSVWLTQGRDRVLRLDRVRDVVLRVQTQGDRGNRYEMQDYPLNSGYWNQEKQNLVPVSQEATLVWTNTGGETVLEVREEYHQMHPDGTETVTEICHSLGRTADYGFELPIARRGECDGDWAMYRVELGLSCYVFCVRFGTEVPGQAGYLVYSSQMTNTASGFERTFTLDPENGAYVHFLVENRSKDLHCFARIDDGERITLLAGEAGAVTAPVKKGDYRFSCGCDIAGIDVGIQIIQTDSPEPPQVVQAVTYAEEAAQITLRLPEGWSYTVSSLEQDDYCAGITFWPTGHEEGVLRLEYYPSRFGVCGTGLETTTMTVAGREVTVGTYDGGALWDYIRFDEYFAVWGEGHESWWEEYGEQAMSILNAVEYRMKVPE